MLAPKTTKAVVLESLETAVEDHTFELRRCRALQWGSGEFLIGIFCGTPDQRTLSKTVLFRYLNPLGADSDIALLQYSALHVETTACTDTNELPCSRQCKVAPSQ